MVADEKEIEFYCYFDIAPLGLLSDCQYDNEFRLGVCEGQDVCDYLEEMEGNPCHKCKKSKQEKLYYPPITDSVIINLLLLVGVDNLNLDCYSTQEDKYKILDYVKTFKQSANSLIRDILIGHLQEWGRM